MKTFKRIDLVIGTTLVAAGFIFTLFQAFDISLLAYFIVGGWQLCSAIAHSVLKKHYIATGHRKIYEIILITLLIGAMICFLNVAIADGSFFMIYLYILLYFSPVLAIYYQVLCYLEYRLLTKRSFIHLKN